MVDDADARRSEGMQNRYIQFGESLILPQTIAKTLLAL